ncbi:hypothetical protein A7K73_07830 [Candidatus Methylacidiphilum fumarolicum]|nr:hypothetical protein A7K73_07830 [Candidatus Methylacidiphilum fumarolicum]TFE77077.1 hypothetical protein A7D33_06550 [Candidatus Methylacidiphilum fumarolicum]
MPRAIHLGTVPLLGIPMERFPALTSKPHRKDRMQPALQHPQAYLPVSDLSSAVVCANPVPIAHMPIMPAYKLLPPCSSLDGPTPTLGTEPESYRLD